MTNNRVTSLICVPFRAGVKKKRLLYGSWTIQNTGNLQAHTFRVCA